MKHLLMGVHQVCSNKSPWIKIGHVMWAYIQVSDFRAIMALLFAFLSYANGLKINFIDEDRFPMCG
jgi:hypothetical protein